MQPLPGPLTGFNLRDQQPGCRASQCLSILACRSQWYRQVIEQGMVIKGDERYIVGNSPSQLLQGFQGPEHILVAEREQSRHILSVFQQRPARRVPRGSTEVLALNQGRIKGNAAPLKGLAVTCNSLLIRQRLGEPLEHSDAPMPACSEQIDNFSGASAVSRRDRDELAVSKHSIDQYQGQTGIGDSRQVGVGLPDGTNEQPFDLPCQQLLNASKLLFGRVAAVGHEDHAAARFCCDRYFACDCREERVCHVRDHNADRVRLLQT